MPVITMVIAVLLILTGAVGFLGTGGTHFTALIPALFGAGLLACGLLARQERFLKHAMHTTALLGLIGLAATVGAWRKLPALLSGNEVARPAAVISQSVMALWCGLLVGLCVASFIQVRRARAVAASTPPPPAR